MTANTVLDTRSGRAEAFPICTSCRSLTYGGPVDTDADHPVPMPEREVVDVVPCPDCGALDGLKLPADRPEGSVVGSTSAALPGGVAICQHCKANVPWSAR